MSQPEKSSLQLSVKIVDDSLESGSDGTSASTTAMTTAHVSETTLKWKLDLLILPLLVSIFLLSVLGQSNIGNAYKAGLAQELAINPSMFANANSLFFVGSIVGQLPATLLLRKLGPSRQFAAAMVAWGCFTIGAAYSRNYGSLVVCRVFIALSESMVQGAVFYLSFWYRYEELAFRAAILTASTSLAGAFSGLLAYGIQKNLDGRNGWSAWRWIFLIEGIVPVCWSIAIALLLPSTPNSIRCHRFGFNENEKAVLVERAASFYNTGNNRIKPKLILQVLIDPQFWAIALIQGGMLLCSSSTSNFLPSIMAGLGYEGVQAQLMSVIPYAFAIMVILITCWLSDLSKLRGVWIIGCCIITAAGYVVLLTTTSIIGRLIATCLVTAGSNAPATICFAWMASANIGYTYRASAVAMVNIVAHLIALGGQQAFIDPPLYRQGEIVALSVILVTVVLTAALMVYFRWINARKRREQYSATAEVHRVLTVDDIGNKHPDFFFSL